MAPLLFSLSSSVATTLPSPAAATPLKHHHEQREPLHSSPATKICRRDAAAAASLLSFLCFTLPPLHRPAPASAFTLGISGPKDWLKEQKKKASRFLLAPVDASRETLRTAQLLFKVGDSEDNNKILGEVKELIKSATRDCVPDERNALVSFQARTGVEVCTFQLVMKNASSLLDDNDPKKLEAEAMLADLIRSLTTLFSVTNEADLQVASSKQKVVDALAATIITLNKFEQGIKDCLEA